MSPRFFWTGGDELVIRQIFYIPQELIVVLALSFASEPCFFQFPVYGNLEANLVFVSSHCLKDIHPFVSFPGELIGNRYMCCCSSAKVHDLLLTSCPCHDFIRTNFSALFLGTVFFITAVWCFLLLRLVLTHTFHRITESHLFQK